ncbi:SDR family NAD(P)-dependent oxidoreductase [Candidatus Pantoea multigeneris]|uniref:SDR family NAD(P)-dependent oxidoreductase n=1 Tax=Candidatus Pantoea multigeneris TaxID=2608357 RepID=A0ABX0RDC9_9GAMM|nr:SDR family NAD(P)-dependent oxidoreductase [Pantoea multigeneris]NIF23052.1 SDR family NAD(P)-dependent oxidoreductase [Pantoea multigeneris]
MQTSSRVLLIGASRGLGFALAETLLQRGYQVVATGRAHSTAQLEQLATRYPTQLSVECVDINQPDEVTALHSRLSTQQFDMLFVNAGVKNDDAETIADVATDEFVRVMVTNALSPMRVIETFKANVTAAGTIAVMSSGLGSVTNNTAGTFEVYRGSKAALNTFMRSFAAREQNSRTLLIMAPGWVRTDMGGPQASLTIEESIPNLLNTMEEYAGHGGLHYLDYLGRVIPW